MSEVPNIHKLLTGRDGVLDSDEELVQFAKSGSETAFVELWRRHSSTVFRAVYRIVKNREDAEDHVQETFLKAIAHLQGFNGASKFSTWLVRIGINTALAQLRKKRSKAEVFFDGLNQDDSEWSWEIADKTIDIEDQFMKSEMISRMNMAIDRLNPSLRTVVEMQQRNDYSHTEIAFLANLSIAAVKSRLSRARRVLRERYV